MEPDADIAVIGAGAAGLFAAIWAGRALPSSSGARRVIALDGARTLGAKILVAGGGRCNVTHHAVDESVYAGSSRNAIKNVLRGFDVTKTIAFFDELGVTLKREDTGKLFPTTDSARTVLDALMRAAKLAGVEFVHPWRVKSVTRDANDFVVEGEQGNAVRARRVVLATGGKSLPKSGSDGYGYEIARSLGHTITPDVFPALVPLILDPQRTFLTELSGLTLDATLELASGSGKKLVSFTNSLLCTHFGLSGPAALDISRYYTAARITDSSAALSASFVPGQTFEQIDAALSDGAKLSIARRLAEFVPERLARAICTHAGVDPSALLSQLPRDSRRAVAHALTKLPLPVTGDRGYTYAEVTAGGVPLSELHLSTMESRICPGLHLCGEICDVDGRIGGFNFQWAWASGHAAGVGAAKALSAT
jgi:predicted Rossmann fold flavoprotein